MLYPKSNAYRDVYSLNGIWEFKTVEDGFLPIKPLNGTPMAVPASYNDLITDKKIKNHEGKVAFERTFSLPVRENTVYRIRIGATSHKCEVYLNGKKIGDGINGFFPVDLPLENLQEENRLSVIIDNRLDSTTLPPGEFKDGKQVIHHDFYNFTGIHRDVLVYTLPQKHIEDIFIKTVVDGDYSVVSVEVQGEYSQIEYIVKDMDGMEVVRSKNATFQIENPVLWDTNNPYLYSLAVKTDCDSYTETFGIRKVEVKGRQVLLNDQPVYFKGFGLHEDFHLLGKGASSAVNIRNFECLKWINANSFRTSHYPYSEEIMELADRYGFMVIDEVPAVGMNRFGLGDMFGENNMVNSQTKAVHKKLIRQLYERDKNHPCIVAFSLANEPNASEDGALEYLTDIFSYAREFISLPLVFVNCTDVKMEKCCHLSDFLLINRYYGWYYNHHGELADVDSYLKAELEAYAQKYDKPILFSEFGADTIEGNHSLPSETFSEEFQMELIEEHCRLFDSLDYVIGEHVWAFADFKTKQGLTRVRGNRKGVFTRERQPKMVAHWLKKRWENK